MHIVKRILFMDDNGTIRRSKSGNKLISGPDDIELIPGVCDRIKKFQDSGFRICIVSNQDVIAHGLKTEDFVEQEFLVTQKLMLSNGVMIDSIFYSPFDQNGHVAPYNMRSLNKKPGYGMIVNALSAYIERNIFVDLDKSLFIGDSDEDKGCADGAGISFVHIDQFLSENFDYGIYL